MSDGLTDACPQVADLVDELVQAHLDTIEMGAYCPPLEWQDHLRYLQGLVRYAKRVTAADLSLDEPARSAFSPDAPQRGEQTESTSDALDGSDTA